jgi:hypothetical protein
MNQEEVILTCSCKHPAHIGGCPLCDCYVWGLNVVSMNGGSA